MQSVVTLALAILALVFEFGGNHLWVPYRMGFNLYDPKYAKLKLDQVSVPIYVGYILCVCTGICVLLARKVQLKSWNWNSGLVYVYSCSILLIIVNSAKFFIGS
jgi:hypothetical protein